MIKQLVCQAFKTKLESFSSGNTFRLESVPMSFRLLHAVGAVSIDPIAPKRWAVSKV